MKEREIDLVDLIVEILLHWRMFIIWMLIGVVISGAYSVVRSHNTVKSQQTQTDKMDQNPEDLLSDEEMQNVNYVIAYEAAYNAQNDYLARAPIMKIDPNHIYKAEATIAVIAKDPNKCKVIESVYEDIVQSSELITKTAEDIGTESTGLNELILLARSNSFSDNFIIQSNLENVAEDANTFRITIIYNNEKQCQNILNAVITFLNEKQPDIERSLGEHSIVVMNESFGIVSDAGVAATQRQALSNTSVMKKELSAAKDNLSVAEQQYYQLLTSEEAGEQIVSSETVSESGISLKHVFFGAVIAPFVYALILFIIYILNTKIRIADNLQELYNIPQLGIIPFPENSKKLFGFIDRWFLSLRNRNKRQFTSEEALELAAVAIKISAGKETLQEISLIGCGLKERSFDICEKIRTRLNEDNIHVNILNNILYDAQSLEELENIKGVVLIGGIGSTLYVEIMNELELLKRQGIKVLGGILIE